MGLFTIFGTSLRALNAYSGALGIVANNIANSSNEDYSRQRVTFSSLPPETLGGVETGRGVSIAGVSQVVNLVLEKRMNTSYQETGQYEARSEYLKSVESVVNEIEGGGLNDLMAKFFNSWTSLSAQPEDLTERQNVLNSAENLIGQFNNYGNQLREVRETIDYEIDAIVPDINSLLTQVADLNQKILESNSEALQLRDERRALINEIGEKIDINYLVGENEIQLFTKDGVPLVTGNAVATLGVSRDATNDNLYDITLTIGGATTNITDRISSGRLKGLIDARDTYIKGYEDKLDDLAYTFADQVNTVHLTGFDLGGTNNQRFFGNLAAVDNASTNLSLDAAVDGSPENISIAAAANEAPGGNDIALSIAALADSVAITFDDGSSNSFTGFYANVLTTIGNDSALAQDRLEFEDNVLYQVKLERTDESGVNVDEEQINLVKYQSAYEAAGRMIKIADSIIDTLMNALG